MEVEVFVGCLGCFQFEELVGYCICALIANLNYHLLLKVKNILAPANEELVSTFETHFTKG